MYLKRSTTTVSNADRLHSTNNIWVANQSGSNTVAYGPSSETGFYVAHTSIDGSYMFGKYDGGVNYPYFSFVNSDTRLISQYNHFYGTSHTTAAQVSSAIDSNNELICTGQIKRSGLEFYLDAANKDSYSGTGNDWNDLSDQGNNGTLNGATYSSSPQSITFDGTNDFLTFDSNITVAPSTGMTFWIIWDLPTQTRSGDWNYFLLHNPAGSHKYEFGNFGTSADYFEFKDNISFVGTNMNKSMNSSGYSCFAFGTTSTGRSFTSLDGENKTIKDPGSNNSWATTPTANLVFNTLFREVGNSVRFFGASVKAIAFYNRELTDDELDYNFKWGAAHRL